MAFCSKFSGDPFCSYLKCQNVSHFHGQFTELISYNNTILIIKRVIVIMKQKLSSIIRIAAVFLVIYLSIPFGDELSILLTESFILGEFITYTATTGSLLVLFWMYCRYILRISAKEFDLGEPYVQKRWLIMALAASLSLFVVFQVLFASQYQSEHINYFSYTYEGVRIILYFGCMEALWQGVLFRGFLFKSLRSAWGTIPAILLLNVLMLIQQEQILIQPDESVVGVIGLLIYQILLCLITLESGSVWPSIWFDMIYRIIFSENIALYGSGFDFAVRIGSYPAILVNCLLIGLCAYRMIQQRKLAENKGEVDL